MGQDLALSVAIDAFLKHFRFFSFDVTCSHGGLLFGSVGVVGGAGSVYDCFVFLSFFPEKRNAKGPFPKSNYYKMSSTSSKRTTNSDDILN